MTTLDHRTAGRTDHQLCSIKYSMLSSRCQVTVEQYGRCMCSHNYLGVHCKFGDNCKHVHVPRGSAVRHVFEQDLTKME